MKFITSLALFVAAATAAPAASDVQTAHLTFRPDASHEAYKLQVKADGKSVLIADQTPIQLIDAPDYLAESFCKFDTVQPGVKFTKIIASDNVTQQVVLNPPSAIKGVSCEGMCVTTYGNCYDDHTGQFVGPCCNGLCVANRCRPWNIGQQ
ncbi:hypothetical protein QQS21_010842 [Conoideocrella luteorostrata]|uniref:SSCRP protein n=1 Tax=Conoideocrella luteorostrata TaxID=1105319 RepID=A0AAJ0CEE9_9HYPO|nr:hypothetical protein QQS21_010842 [Conoideocrella luteorostrata]